MQNIHFSRKSGERHTTTPLSFVSPIISTLGIKVCSEQLTLLMSMTLTVSCCQEVAVRAESQHPYTHPRVGSVSYWLQSLQGHRPGGDLIWNTNREDVLRALVTMEKG